MVKKFFKIFFSEKEANLIFFVLLLNTLLYVILKFINYNESATTALLSIILCVTAILTVVRFLETLVSMENERGNTVLYTVNTMIVWFKFNSQKIKHTCIVELKNGEYRICKQKTINGERVFYDRDEIFHKEDVVMWTKMDNILPN